MSVIIGYDQDKSTGVNQIKTIASYRKEIQGLFFFALFANSC